MYSDEQRRQFSEQARRLYEQRAAEYMRLKGDNLAPKNWNDLDRFSKDFWISEAIKEYGEDGSSIQKGY